MDKIWGLKLDLFRNFNFIGLLYPLSFLIFSNFSFNYLSKYNFVLKYIYIYIYVRTN